MKKVNNKMRRPIESDARGFRAVVDEAADGSKAIPVTFVYKTGNGFSPDGTPPSGGPNNKMKKAVEADAQGETQVVDEDVNGVKAIPLVVVKKNEDGEFEYADLGGGEVAPHTHEIADINGLQTALNGKANTSHTHSISQVSGLQAALDSKLTATQAAAQADSTAADVATLVADFNALLAKLRAAGIMAE